MARINGRRGMRVPTTVTMILGVVALQTLMLSSPVSCVDNLGLDETTPAFVDFDRVGFDEDTEPETFTLPTITPQSGTSPDPLELLSDDDKVTISLGGGDWALALDHINSSATQFGKLAEHQKRRFHGLFNESSPTEQPGIFNAKEASGESAGDDLFVVPKKVLLDTFEAAEEKWLSTKKLLDERFSSSEGADSKSPVGTAFAFNAPSEEALAMSNTSSLLEIASRQFLESLEGESVVERKKRSTSTRIVFRDDDLPDIVQAEESGASPSEKLDSLHTRYIRKSTNSMNGPDTNCGLQDEVLPCDTTSKFRSFSGFCNNIQHPSWGKSVITFDRMIGSKYDDGISVPRMRAQNGGLLPSPRQISSAVHIDVSHLSNKHTLLLMQFAQFVDHDITFTPVHKGPEGKILNCRDCDSQQSVHPECWPIRIPQGDSWYPQNTENGRPTCIPFTRSLPGQQRLGPRDQINQNSAFMDSSQIYGENICKALSLRAPGGLLNITVHPVHGSKPLLPRISTLKECKSPSGFCFYAGDLRASEQPALATVHTIYLRAHNSWATSLRSLNSHWDDERVYQETRRIMIAVNQHIVYTEMLPRLLGNSMVNAYGLTLQGDGYYAGYDANCPANIYNEFSTAAFRFGHSLIRPNLARMDNKFNGMTPHIQLRDGFFNSDMLNHPLMVDEIMRGLLGEPMEQLDPFVTEEVTNHLFEDKKKQFSGMDLIALNIHRGRDHGLSGYNSYREVCSLKRANTFQDLSSEIPQDVLNKLQQIYTSVDDIDLFTGSLSERPVQGALLGPTMTCIIATQFKRIRQCDRFWYESNDPVVRFTSQQLAEIRKMTLSKVVCDNLDVPSDIQKSAFDAPHNVLNPRIPCEKLPTLNLDAWREAPPAPSQTNVRRCTIGSKQIAVGGSALPSPCVSCICTHEGTRCASLRITSCQRLFQEANLEDISKDKICMSQCGFLMGSSGRHPNEIVKFISTVAKPLRRSS